MRVFSTSAVFASALLLGHGVVMAQDGCPSLTSLDPPMERSLAGMSGLAFVGVTPKVAQRVAGDPMIRITGYTGEPPIMEEVDGTMYVRAASCADGTGSGTSAPTGAPAAVSGGLSLLGKRMGSMMTCFTTFAAGSALAGASPLVAGGFGAVMAGLSNGLPMAQAQDTSCVDEIIVEIHGPTMGDEDMAAKIAELEAANAELQAQLEGSVSAEMAVDMQFDLLVQEIAFDDYVRTTPKKDQSLSRLLNSNSAQYYNKAGLPILERHNPEPAFYLKNADDDSLLRDMQGDVFQLPTTSNTFDEVLFSLPDPPAYSEPSDLYYMPILQIASLLRSGAVDCVTIVQAFIDRLQEFDPYLAIVITPLYERALGTAASHDQLLANGTDTGALMCIPFGLKDHHQVYDDEPTTYGHILYTNNVHTVKSTLMQKLMEAGAIPIAKMVLGTFASGPVSAWGQCMSPYMNGDGGGSSCGSGSGAALGALPFAISEETLGSISSPAHSNLISGHIGSYGTISRAGAGLLCSETDHLGFHSRYLSDFGAIFNYVRTGSDPEDGDATDFEYINPYEMDVTQLRVMIIEGSGNWVQDEDGRWGWDGGALQSFSKSAWHWPERVERIKSRLDAAGVPWDSYTIDEAGALWSFDESTPFFDCANPDLYVMMGGGPWAKNQEFELAMLNCRRSTLANVPMKDYRYMRYCTVEIGKQFLNDDVWNTYDVIIETDSFNAGGKANVGGSFEQWVRTAKTFVVDYMEQLPCLHESGSTVEAALVTLTALPFQDHKNFAIGDIIQNPDDLLLPDENAIKTYLANRTRCPYDFYDYFNDPIEACPAMNGPGAPPNPYGYSVSSRCTPGRSVYHLPDDWANEPFVPPYELEEMSPDRAIYRYEDYEPVVCLSTCTFLPSFCEMKGIVCDETKLAEEEGIMATQEFRKLMESKTIDWEGRRLDELEEINGDNPMT